MVGTPHSEDVDALLNLWDAVAAGSPLATEELERDYRMPSVDEYSELDDLPHIQRETSSFDPAEYRVETYQDVLEAEQRSREPESEWTTWRFDPPK